MNTVRRFSRHLKAARRSGPYEHGQAVVEYALILSFITVITVPIMLGLGKKLGSSYEKSAREILSYEYEIRYNANGGTGAPEKQIKQEGTDVALSSDIPVWDGHDFVGWARTSTADEKEFSPGDTYSEDADLNLYAIWLQKTYTVSFNPNGGTGGPDNQTKIHSEKLTLPDETPVREGCDFLGWSTDSKAVMAEYSPGSDYSRDENAVLYAVWAVKTYTVTYNANGGTGAPSGQTKIHGTELTLSSTKPTRSGYTFLGWSSSSGAASATYSAGGRYTADSSTVLYAVWSLNTYTITYNANGGSGAPSSQTKTHGSALTLSSTKPTRSGYTFLGWSTSSGAASATYSAGGRYTSDSSAVLYAVWSVNTYTVTYSANGGTGAPSSQTKIYGQSLILSSTKPTRANYEFVGWSASSSATAATYSAGGTYTSNSSVTLYAVWKQTEQPRSITIDVSGNSSIYAADTGNSYGAWVSGTLDTMTPSSNMATLNVFCIIGQDIGSWYIAKEISYSSVKVYKNGALLAEMDMREHAFGDLSKSFYYEKGSTVTFTFVLELGDYDRLIHRFYEPVITLTQTVQF